VRDLLLGLRPKDYDIATAARPQQVKRTFPRNCRIIGRRFKLAHLHFHDNTKILEVSTFRRLPQMDNAEDDLLIRHDNEFGTAEEDALRRDFTVNALFLDPLKDRILDYANGLEDLRTRTIRTIGDPRVRFREDPVRILRAAKFAGRLGFHVDPDTLAAMAEAAPDLVRSAPPRLLEEILRLLRGGHALDSFQLLRDVGALKSLLPTVADFLGAAAQPQRVIFWRVLEALDHSVHEGRVPSNPVLLGTLFVCPVQALCERQPNRSPSTVAEELLGPLGQTLRLPRRDAGCLKRICGVQHRFVQIGDQKRFKVQGFVHGPYFDEALDLFALRAHATGIDEAIVAEWQELAGSAPARERRPGGQMDDTARLEGAPDDAAAAAGGSDDADEGASESAESEREGLAPVTSETAETRAQGDDGGDGGRRRRRRRRRRRGRGGDGAEARGPVAAGGPPDGDEPEGGAMDEPFEQASELREGSEAPSEADEGPGDGEEPEHGAQVADAQPDAGTGGEPGQPGERRRRRRRRRRRGRGGDGGAAGGQPDGGEAAQSHEQQPGQHGQHQHEREPRHELPRQDGPRQDQPRQEQPRQDQPRQEQPRQDRPRQDRPRQGGQRERGEQREGGDRGERGGRRKRRRERHRDRDRRGAPRDVDVVPRGQDRRGKVDVIEPKQLDLTAFDIELDPKRVPTFGSIVEGKGRPKRRGPRVPDEGKDDYKPPPPPGSGGDPGGAPPPPPPDDTFGDW